jgi:hypothetical protein
VDDTEYKFRLSQIGRWYIPIVNGRTSLQRKPMPDSQTNPSLGPVLDEVYPILKDCQWCGKLVDQKTKHTLRFMSIDGKRPERRWEHKCQTCKRQLDAQTGKLKEETKSRNQIAKEQHEKTNKSSAVHWWNDPAVYTVSDKDKLGENKA